MVDVLGRDVSGVASLGSGARSWALHAFNLVALPGKVMNGTCERGCNGKLIPKKSSQSG